MNKLKSCLEFTVIIKTDGRNIFEQGNMPISKAVYRGEGL